MAESTQLLDRPATQIATVYSNFDHEFDRDVADELAAHPGDSFAQHAAWDFCGYVWRLDDGRWIDQVWRWNAPVADIFGDTLEGVIAEANDRYGDA